LAFSKGEPDWMKVDYSKYPAMKWKLQNINKLKEQNLPKYNDQIDAAKQVLSL
jgi:hypothetical protein